MTIVATTRPKAKSNNFISEYELRQMEKSEFKCIGWQKYSDSPYAQYKKQMDILKGESDEKK